MKRLVNDWDEKTVTWNNGPYGEGIISDYLNFTPQTDVTHHQETEITDMVRGWYSKLESIEQITDCISENAIISGSDASGAKELAEKLGCQYRQIDE